jgi:hypothetical protein
MANDIEVTYNGKTYKPQNYLPPRSIVLQKEVKGLIKLKPEQFIFDPDDDTTKYIRFPDTGPPQKRGFERPWILIPGTDKCFVWPGGVEGFTLEGKPELGVYKYIGDIDVDAVVIYPDEPRITMDGTFPGHTSDNNMRTLRSILSLAQVSRRKGMVLHVPYVLPRAQFVLCDSYSFSHGSDERTQNINYSVSFLKIGEGSRQWDTPPTRGVSIPARTPPAKSKEREQRTYTVKANNATMRSIISDIYGSEVFNVEDRYANAAAKLYDINEKTFSKLHIPLHRAGTMKIPPGTKLRF